MSRPATARSISCARKSNRRAGRRWSAGSVGSVARSPSRAGYREPLLVASTDGVGTKTAIAAALLRFDTIGIDLVAMCADDVVCSGAEPLAFLDYVAVGHVVPEGVAELVGSVAAGCREAGCALVGGETAEHPGLMTDDAFDLSGCCIGVVERADLLDGTAAEVGDVILGLPSSGLHANGYSLVRALLAQWELRLDEPYQVAPAADAGRRGGRRGHRGRTERGDGDARRSPPDADADLRAGRPRCARGSAGRRLGSPRPGPHHGRRPAGQRPTGAAGRSRRATGPGARGRCPRSCAVRRAGWARRTRSFGRPSTAVSGWSSSCRRTPSRPRSRLSRTMGSIAVLVGDVVEASSVGGARYVERPLEAATVRRDRPDRRRRLRRRVEPARAASRPLAAASSAARSSSCSPIAPARRSTGRRSRGSRRRSFPAATTRRSPTTLAAVAPRCGRARRLHADRRPGRARCLRPAGSSTRIRRCFPAFPGAHAVARRAGARRRR